MEVAPGIYHFKTEPFNWYVIEEGGRLTVVASGFPGYYTTLLEGISSLGYTLKDVEAVVLTHAHADHIGFAERLRKASGASVFIHEDDLTRVKRVYQLPPVGFIYNLWRPFVRRLMAEAIRAGAFRVPSITHAFTFKDGDVLEVPGRPLILHAPGHTEGEVALYLSEREVLLSGDVLVTMNLMTGEVGNPRVPYASLNDDYEKAARSTEALLDIGRVTLLPGHGTPWRGTMREAVCLAQEEHRSSPRFAS